MKSARKRSWDRGKLFRSEEEIDVGRFDDIFEELWSINEVPIATWFLIQNPTSI